jgi:hypothetical protein
MSKIISALTARTQFGQIMERAAQRNDRFIVEHRGQPKVIILGVRDFIEIVAPAPDELKVIWSESRRKDVKKLKGKDVEAEIAAYRRKN